MNITSKYTILAAALALTLTACDENEWNEKLDGFEVPPAYSKTETILYTLTAADYKTIATNSTNEALAEKEGDAAVTALAAVETDCAFATEEDARLYIPALLSSSSFPYFALNNGSSIKVTYNLSTNQPAEVLAINDPANVSSYTVTEADYQLAWGSDDDFIGSFAPAVTAASKLPAILKNVYDDAVAGQYVVVSYKEASTNPIFGSVGGSDEPEEEWAISSVIGSVQVGDAVEINGIVTAIDTRGFILTDATGSILCYQSSGFSTDAVSIGTQVTLNGSVTAYNTGLQIAITSDSYTVEGVQDYTYPTPKTVTGADMDAAVARTGDSLAEYVTFIGKASVSGNYYNFIVDGASSSQGSGYMVPDYIRSLMTDGETYTICGYFSSVSSGKYYNVVITSVDGKTTSAAAAPALRRAPAAEVPSESKNAIYYFNGSTWSVPASTVILQPSDYTAMGSTYGNLSSGQPEEFLPKYLSATFPYATEGDEEIVVYKLYSNGSTTVHASQLIMTDGVWEMNTGATTDQFSKSDNVWVYNPSVIITLPYSRNTDPSYSYYMECLNWVWENVTLKLYPDSKPADGTAPGPPFIDYRNNAEYYSGASAYYGNVDVRATTALNNAPDGYTGYDGLTNEEITLLIKKRFSTETLPYAVAVMNPDAKPGNGMDVTYTVNFTAYDGAANTETIVYVVTAPGVMTYKSSTWVEEGQDADW